MKTFLFKIMVFILIIFSILLSLNYRWTNTEVYLLEDEKYRDIDMPKQLDICNLGSSHGMFGFEYTYKSDIYKGFNLGSAVQNFHYDLQMLKQNKHRLHKGSVIYIPISYFSYYSYLDEQSFLQSEDLYYRKLSFWRIREPSLDKLVELKWFPVLFIDKDQYKYLLKDDKGIIEEYDKVFLSNRLIDKETGKLDIKRMIQERDKTVALHSANFDRGMSRESIGKLKEILEYCRDKEYQPILITTPYSSYYNDAEVFDDEFMDRFYELTLKISDEYNVPYWDYSKDIIFEYNIELFYDDDHLNYHGRKMFSDIIIKRTIDEGYLE